MISTKSVPELQLVSQLTCEVYQPSVNDQHIHES